MNDDRYLILDEISPSKNDPNIGAEIPASGWEGYNPEVLDRLEE
jgi:hypothetical protein